MGAAMDHSRASKAQWQGREEPWVRPPPPRPQQRSAECLQWGLSLSRHRKVFATLKKNKEFHITKSPPTQALSHNVVHAHV